MPVEIRELNIKTQIHSEPKQVNDSITESELTKLKQQLMDQCKKMINARMNKTTFNR